MEADNIFKLISNNLDKEVFECLLQNENIKIERIISKGHTSPESGWYDQEQDEWVIVLKGAAVICFEGGEEINFKAPFSLNDGLNRMIYSEFKKRAD